jgi:uncharacterized repeat protein (TIGR02059 family)
MKNALIIVFLLITVTLNATTYYVSTTGSDSNPGTLSQPWATWQKGFNSISAGDILYIRSGTYVASSVSSSGMYCGVAVAGKTGSSGNQYIVSAYPGEIPVLDCSGVTGNAERIGILIMSSSYWHLLGLEVKNTMQQSTGSFYGGQGILVQNSNNVLIENCNSHNNQGPGMGVRVPSGNDCDFLNCDAHDNYNPYGSQGDAADGFDVGFSSNDYIIRLTGCRSWNNSSDGFDMYQYPGYTGIYYLTNCWAWHIGYATDEVTPVGGGGNGFKFGSDQQAYTGVTKRTAYNCVAYDNYKVGFSQQSADVKMVLYNNTSYKNGIQGFEFTYYNCADILKNNISYNNGSTDIFQTNQTRTNNSWQNGLTVTNSDFASVDGTQLILPRKSDGSLPDISFMHLATGSHLIDAGVDVGIPFSGSAPDLGAFENQSGTASTIPVFSSAAVENATPSLLELTYNTTLANVVPAASAFSVMVNSIARTVNTVTISGLKVQLALASPVVSGDVVTVAYTKPSANPVQTASGGQAASLTVQTVTNKVVAAIPGYVSSVVNNSTPSLLEMTYSLTLANIVPAVSAFQVLVNTVAVTVSKVAISGAKVQLTLSNAIKFGDIVAVSYTKPATAPLQTSTGGFASSISSQSVTNNLINPAKDGTSITIAMTITPNHIHKVFNMSLVYTGSLATQAASITPEIIRITDLSGNLLLEKVIVTGTTNIRIPVNLDSGVYNVVLSGGGYQMAAQKIMVH